MTDQLALPVFSRRAVLGVSAGVAALPSLGGAQTRTPATPPPGHMEVVLIVNGQDNRLSLDPRTTLLDALREHLQLTGSKKGCDQGQCGACTVHVDGRRVLSCLTLALAVDGHQVTTIEGLSRPGEPLHSMQQAFIDLTASSAATAPRARSCRRWPASAKAMQKPTTRSVNI
jgi:xanthine dehydrogenase YagT iron-sulfur-binding subunit